PPVAFVRGFDRLVVSRRGGSASLPLVLPLLRSPWSFVGEEAAEEAFEGGDALGDAFQGGQGLGGRGALGGEGVDHPAHHVGDLLPVGVGAGRQRAGEQLVGDHAGRVDVGGGGHPVRPVLAFGRDVVGVE